MGDQIDTLFEEDPKDWILALPDYQGGPIVELIQNGNSFEDVAQRWVTATAENTYRLGAPVNTGDKSAFLVSVKAEIRAYLCGGARYKKERDGLFGEKGLTRTYVVTGIAVAIAPHLGVAAPC